MRSRRTIISSVLATTGAAAFGMSFNAGAATTEPLRFFNWDTYIGENTLSAFKTASGTNVIMTLFSSNDELYSRMSGGESYDIIVPSSDFLPRMVDAGLLAKLDHSRLPNLANISPRFLDPIYDPHCAHSVPFAWLVLGLGYRKSRMKNGKAPDSWKAVFEPGSYRVAWSSDAADMMRLGARSLGYDVNALTTTQVHSVEAMLTQAAPSVTFHQDDGQDMLLDDQVDIVIEYNGDIFQMMERDSDLGFVVPQEGSLGFVDSWAIPKAARNPSGAYRFLDFMMSPDAGVDISKSILYPTPNDAARRLMPASYRDSSVLFPPADRLASTQFTSGLTASQAKALLDAFARVRAAAGR